ncbi:MAG: exonuclease domain-containing protein [Clostridiales bacterium]|jgi:inhibitor of KinA sporulation pathway (predicted exonuclease)|nr:exonuclease domain-containing protein [Clostridiales bacterium]
MGYIVMDMEWNQAMSSQSAVFNKLPIHLRGEIIQIGAVRLTDDFLPGDEFQIDVRPVFFKKMHYKVEKLTGIDKYRLEHGLGFKEAFAKFREWCGEGTTFLTWGCDDRNIMEQNIIVHDLDWDWIDRWINLQVIYNVQTEAGRNQTGLSIAMEHFGIEQTRVAHDALGDAYNTSLVCSKLDLLSGIEQYDNASKVLSIKNCKVQNGGDNAQEAIEHNAFTGYPTREEAFSSKAVSAPECPVCGGTLSCSRWINQGDRRYMALCSCKDDGQFLVRIKLRLTADDTWTVNRIIYRADEKQIQYYKSKAHPEGRRRKRRSKKATAAHSHS